MKISPTLKIARNSLLFTAVASTIMACGGGSSPSTTTPPLVQPIVTEVLGMGIKGALAKADVAVYQFDAAEDGRGQVLATGQTNAEGKISGLTLSGAISGYYLLEFTQLDTTVDLSTGNAPVLDKLVTLVEASRLTTKQQLYATPLSTMATRMAINYIQQSVTISDAMQMADLNLQSMLNINADEDINIWLSVPLFDKSIVTDQQMRSALKIRTANEIVISVASEILTQQQSIDFSVGQVLDDMANDFSDEKIDANFSGTNLATYDSQALVAFVNSPQSLNVPGADNLKVSDTLTLMLTESQQTNNTEFEFSDALDAVAIINELALITLTDWDDDGLANAQDQDDDNDGVIDIQDDFPLDSEESLDSDKDGTGDNSDIFPFNGDEQQDTDRDGIGNNADKDDDGDGVIDELDMFPLDIAESVDSDGDGIGNNADTDDDNDGFSDSVDMFPFDANEYLDTDGDGIGNNADRDDDGDGVVDESDIFPLDIAESIDTDGDGIGNNADTDDDNDGFTDEEDAFPFNPAELLDTDGDGIGNNADPDDDNDGVLDESDAFPLDATEFEDSDLDGLGNNADPDDDNDGYADDEDAFPLDSTEYIDTDGDGIGNIADPDDDNDNVLDESDAFPLEASEYRDFDGDSLGDNTDTDDDNDGIEDDSDLILVSAIKDNYSIGEPIKLRILFVDKTGKELNDQELNYAKFYTFDIERTGRYLTRYTQNGIEDATYDATTGEWIVSFSAPDYSGNFYTEISAKCKNAVSDCAEDSLFIDRFLYSVSCPVSNCPYIPDVPQHTFVTNYQDSTDTPSVVRRSNNDIVVSYRRFGSDVVYETSVSKNNGKTWEVLKKIPQSPTSTIMETDINALAIGGWCTSISISGFCLYLSENDDTTTYWTTKRLTNNTNFFNCWTTVCETSNIYGEKLFQTSEGLYIFTFTYRENLVNEWPEIYLTTSWNLQTWSNAIQITDNDNFDSSVDILESQSGQLYMSYLSYAENAIVVLKSSDATNWTRVGSVGGSFSSSTSTSLVENSAGVWLFYPDSSTFKGLQVTETELTSPKIAYDNGYLFEPDVIMITDDIFGIFYMKDIDGERDISFDTFRFE
ncbi:thrombospondin type 3 repeat-containing protein [Alteromonadaceae bacterium BrNp21-10]|nr:thrombospondin type 3 repeat-containing protein [Alteromonadaceae bacterium BrNp21-10]